MAARSETSSRSGLVWILLVGVLFLGLFLLWQVYLGNPELGDLVVQSDDDAAKLHVVQQSRTLHQAIADRTISLPAGEYQLNLVDAQPGSTLSASDVQVKAGEKVMVRISKAVATRPVQKQPMSNNAKSQTEPPGKIYSVAFSPDGKTLASGDGDRRVTLWDVEPLRPRLHLPEHSRVVTGLSFGNQGKTLASSTEEGAVRLWDVSGEQPKELPGPGIGGNPITLSHDGSLLGSASWFHMRLWSLAKDKPREGKSFSGHFNLVRAVALSRDGRLAAFLAGGDVRLYDVHSFDNADERAVLPGHANSGLAISPESSTLAATTSEGVQIWDLKSKQPSKRISCKTNAVWLAFAGTERLLVTAGSDGKVSIWDLSTPDVRCQVLAEVTSTLRSLSPDGRILATADKETPLRLLTLPIAETVSSR